MEDRLRREVFVAVVGFILAFEVEGPVLFIQPEVLAAKIAVALRGAVDCAQQYEEFVVPGRSGVLCVASPEQVQIVLGFLPPLFSGLAVD